MILATEPTGGMFDLIDPRTRPAMVKCLACKSVKRVDITVHGHKSQRHFQVVCNCRLDRRGDPVDQSTYLRVEFIKATVTAHKCDARCTHAKGHVCDCSCGGKYHGTGN